MKKRILVVDDEPGFTHAVRRSLERIGGYEVRELNHATDVLPTARDFKPDLVVISAGFDAHTRDPLARDELVQAYRPITVRDLLMHTSGLCYRFTDRPYASVQLLLLVASVGGNILLLHAIAASRRRATPRSKRFSIRGS